MYQGFYINLERAERRRRVLEEHLEQAGLLHRYTRFPAIDGSKVTYGPGAVQGTPMLGCTLSHLSVIKDQLHSGRHLHIIEDDAVLHPRIPQVFEAFVGHRELGEWDILQTDLFLPPDVYLFKYLHRKYQECTASGNISFLHINNWEFAGASSYFVNGKSKEKLLQLVEGNFAPEIPYDLRVRALAKQGLINVYACFPFFSTLSSESSASTIAGDFQQVLPLLEYRRSFYIDADHAAIDKALSFQQIEPDQHMRTYLSLVLNLLDPKHESF